MWAVHREGRVVDRGGAEYLDGGSSSSAQARGVGAARLEQSAVTRTGGGTTNTALLGNN